MGMQNIQQSGSYLAGRHYQTGEPIALGIDGGMITGCRSFAASNDLDQHGGAELPWIAPGLVDLQINGYAGMDLNALDLSEEEVVALSGRLWAEGVTSFYPTIITGADESIQRGLEAIDRACRRLEREEHDVGVMHNIAGIHLEGPFISKEDGPRGAHNRAFVRAPDCNSLDRWQQSAGGRIRIVTLSPEWPESEAFITLCIDHGIVPAIGHTAATAGQIGLAAAAGARLSTHLGNGAHPVLPRHPHYIWDQLAEDRLWASVIADGFHLPDAFLKVAHKVKGEQLILVSDAVSLAGMSPGVYETPVGGNVTLTEQGRLHLTGQPALLAGSALPLVAGIGHMEEAGICSLGEAWDMASVRPSRLMNLPTSAGLTPGAPADIAMFTLGQGKIGILETYKQGRLMYRDPDADK
ncbi:N-acetylglucosamine-6-phosphate deacetylase [Paenibacillus sp.]|jgi:N-acetylglucosamine-6-phosphate deacetylase|uniref:N-acetylglucosamine-6-phosphate deacetylase n=1 Tax=Paenibacillus sp. TaxID=58172 RepID=UPI00281E0FE7|nr:N-acetylglucosamine-6-phosphate deacetylase [Paenibacillus sp.]MDR0271605.1 amidohydrolase family protein [Paenibacillus sp.]